MLDALDEMVRAIDRRFQQTIDRLVHVEQRHADLSARIERMVRKGTVTDVDATQGLARVQIGLDDDGGPIKSPWLPYSQVAGARKEHSPPSVGQQMAVINPDGSQDFSQGFIVPHGWYDQQPSPSTDPASDVVTRGSTKDVTTASSRTISVGGASFTISDGNLTITAANIKLNGNVDVNS